VIDLIAIARSLLSPVGSSGLIGFIGTNKSAPPRPCELVADYNDGCPTLSPSRLPDDRLIRDRRPEVVDGAGWKAIDQAEISRGGEQRPRNKFTAVPDMLAAAATAPSPPLGRRILAGLFR
jgi:ferredoxin--NADP+ reductase